MRYWVLALFLFLAPSAFPQNCTGTKPVMNIGLIASGNSVVGNPAGDNGCAANSSLPGCVGTTAGTITVTLQAPFNSPTGYVTTYRVTNLKGNGKANDPSSVNWRGWNNSYPIVSNINTTLVLRAPGVTAGSYAGIWVSDLKQMRVSARQQIIEWTTPGYNSTSTVTYAGDGDAGGLPGNTGAQNTDIEVAPTVFDDPVQIQTFNATMGTSYHSVTLNNLDITIPTGTNFLSPVTGMYWFGVTSRCFNPDGTVDQTSGASLPPADPVICMPGQNCGNLPQIAPCTGDPTATVCLSAGPAQQFITGDVDVVAGQNTFSMMGYNGKPSIYARIPIQDGAHPGFRTMAGAPVIIPFAFWDVTIPSSGSSTPAAFTVTDDAGPGLITNFVGPAGNTPASTIYRGSGNTNIVMELPDTVPSGGAGCTTNAGTILTLDDGVPACAYPLRISALKSGGGCGTTVVCGPEGTTAASCAPASVCNLPDTAKLWIIVMDKASMWPPKGNVGPWINTMSGQPGMRCETYDRQMADNCQHQGYGLVGISGNYFSYEGQQQDNCAWNGSMSPGQVVTTDSNWFYDGAYVCHTLEVLFGHPTGIKTGMSMSNEHYVQHILGTFWDAWMPRKNDITLTATYPVAAPATSTFQYVCGQIAGTSLQGKAPGSCGIMTVPIDNVGPIADMLDAGQTLRACFNSPDATSGRNYSCGVLGTNANRAFTATVTAGGNLPPGAYTIDTVYTGPDGLLSYISNTAPTRNITDATCPTSGNCSITVTGLTQIPNATGWNVYAWTAGTTQCQQNTAGPIGIGVDFVIGSTATPLVTGSCTARPLNYNAFTTMVLSADRAMNTITVDASTTNPLPSNAINTRVIITKAFVGIPADAGSDASTIICANCQFDSINLWNVVYCGGAAAPGEPLFSSAPYRGSLISSIDIPNHTLHLLNPVHCGPGVKFEIRNRLGPPQNLRIYNWGTSSYDQWERFHNYIAADMVLYLTANAACGASGPFNNCAPGGATTPGILGAGWDYAARRENSLAVRNCQLALDVNAETGGDTALALGSCGTTFSQRAGVAGLMQMIDTQIHNGVGNGSIIGSFLNGLQMRSLLLWWLDPARGVQDDPRFLYWSRAMADTMWQEIEGAQNVTSPLCTSFGGTGVAMSSTGMIPQFPSEWGYIISKGSCAGGYAFTIGGRLASDYWSIYGNVYPMYAFLYQYTGNAVIPAFTANKNYPGYTYGDAYNHIATWGFVYQASNNTTMHPKTLGEMGLWQEEALQWMMGTGGTPPPVTSLTPAFVYPIP